ncbi:MAG: hypothetical protein RLN99_11880 [Kiloniellaceae bacterium]
MGLSLVLALAGLGSQPAAATPLISFTDNAPSDRDYIYGFAEAIGWTQTVATSNVTVTALFDVFIAGPVTWWITNKIGAGTLDPDNVLFSGTVPVPAQSPGTDFNIEPQTVLGTGLNFAIGTYYLVIDPGFDALWLGDRLSNVTANLAPGFTYDGLYQLNSAGFPPSGNPSDRSAGPSPWMATWG